jgi:hypothetical protein
MTNTTTSQLEKTNSLEGLQNAPEPTDYANRLRQGQVTDHAANEIDQAVPRNRGGDNSSGSDEGWKILGNAFLDADPTAQFGNQSKTPFSGWQDNSSQSLAQALPELSGAEQLLGRAINALNGDGQQMQTQDSANNPQAAQLDLQLAQTGLAIANLGLDLYQLDANIRSGSGANTSPGGDMAGTDSSPPESSVPTVSQPKPVVPTLPGGDITGGNPPPPESVTPPVVQPPPTTTLPGGEIGSDNPSPPESITPPVVQPPAMTTLPGGEISSGNPPPPESTVSPPVPQPTPEVPTPSTPTNSGSTGGDASVSTAGGDTSGGTAGSSTAGGGISGGTTGSSTGGSDTSSGTAASSTAGSDTGSNSGSVLTDTNIYTTAQALGASVTQDGINSLVNPNNNQVYLTADANAATGNGSSASQPLFAGTASAFDQIVQADGANTTFHLAPGTYQTNGYDSSTSGPGDAFANSQFIGSGMDNTIIQLAPTASVSAQGSMIFGSPGDSSGFTVAGVTLDGNANGVSAFDQNGGGSITDLGVAGSNITMYGDKFEGFASSDPSRENFAVSVSPDGGGWENNGLTANNDVVSHSVFTNPGNDDGSQQGDSILGLPSGSGDLATNNWFGGMTPGNASSFGAITGPGYTAEYNFVDPTVNLSVYTEPENPSALSSAAPGSATYDQSGAPTVIRNNNFQGGGMRFNFDAEAQQDGDVTIANNNFGSTNAQLTNGIVVADPFATDTASPWFNGNFTVDNNTFAGSTLTDPGADVFANGVNASGNTDENGNAVSVAA